MDMRGIACPNNRWSRVGFNCFVQCSWVECDQSHALFDRVLRKYVKEARVNYAVLKADSQDLNRYLGQVAAVTTSEFTKWTDKRSISAPS